MAYQRTMLQFKLCILCQKHGHFHLDELNTGPEVGSKKTAQSFLDDALRLGQVSTDEVMLILQQIQRSKMAEEDGLMLASLAFQVIDWNIARRASNGYFSSESMHEAYEMNESVIVVTTH